MAELSGHEVHLSGREIKALLEAASYYDAQQSPPNVRHLRYAARKLQIAVGDRPNG